MGYTWYRLFAVGSSIAAMLLAGLGKYLASGFVTHLKLSKNGTRVAKSRDLYVYVDSVDTNNGNYEDDDVLKSFDL